MRRLVVKVKKHYVVMERNDYIYQALSQSGFQADNETMQSFLSALENCSEQVEDRRFSEERRFPNIEIYWSVEEEKPNRSLKSMTLQELLDHFYLALETLAGEIGGHIVVKLLIQDSLES